MNRDSKIGMLTWPQSTLVNPCVQFSALAFHLVDPDLHVLDLGLEVLDLLAVWADGGIEGLSQQIWHWLGLCVHGSGRVVHWHRIVAVRHLSRRVRLLRLMLAGVHFLLGGRRDVARVAVVLGVGALVVAVVVLVLVDVGISSLGVAAFEEHIAEKASRAGCRVDWGLYLLERLAGDWRRG